MQDTNASTKILRTAGWIWISFLAAMLVMDIILYLPNIQKFLALAAPINQTPLIQQNAPPPPPGQVRMFPIFTYYIANFFVALVFISFTHWSFFHKRSGAFYYPFLLLLISTAPIFINSIVVPRFPPGPLSNAEGMTLRQLPVLFVGLALTAWEYGMLQIIAFSIATALLELGLILGNGVQYENMYVFFFIAVVRSISFVALGIFINLLVRQLKEQGESLKQANANLAHYASTLEQLTVSRERNRLARELHDTLAHSLTALSVSLETAKAYFDVDQEKTRELIDRSLEATRKGVDETRRALKALRSSDLEDLGLKLALQRMAESAAARFNLKLELDLKKTMPSLSPDVEQAVYRIAQESVENIVNHARAKTFSLRLEHDARTRLIIEDDGIGFDPSKEPSGHFGLMGMRERAELAGGKIRFESIKGKGTKIILEI